TVCVTSNLSGSAATPRRPSDDKPSAPRTAAPPPASKKRRRSTFMTNSRLVRPYIAAIISAIARKVPAPHLAKCQFSGTLAPAHHPNSSGGRTMAALAQDVLTRYPLNAATRAFLDRVGPMFIAGNWVMSSSGRTIDVYDPATARVIAKVADADKKDVDLA